MSTVLAINDDPENLILLTVQLLKLGYQVMSGCSEDAFHLAHALKPGVIFVDFIPADREDDLRLVRQFRELDAFRDTPVIVFSARTEELDVQAALRAGASDFIKKPYDISVVERVMADYPLESRPRS